MKTLSRKTSLLPTQAAGPGEALSRAVWDDGWSWSKGQRSAWGTPSCRQG